MAVLKIDDFELRQISFEIRYPSNPLLWDRCGHFWKLFTRNSNDFNIKKENPSEQSFEIGGKYNATLKLDRGFLIAYWPKENLTEFCERIDDFTKHLVNLLEIQSFKRIGARFIYNKQFEDSNKAGRALLDESFLTGSCLSNFEKDQKATKNYFDLEGPVKEPNVYFRRESETYGCLIHFQATTEKLDISTPPEIRENIEKSEEKHFLLMDLDFYNKGEIMPEKFTPSTWVKDKHRLIRRDFDNLMG